MRVLFPHHSLSLLARQTGAPATQGGRGETKNVGKGKAPRPIVGVGSRVTKTSLCGRLQYMLKHNLRGSVINSAAMTVSLNDTIVLPPLLSSVSFNDLNFGGRDNSCQDIDEPSLWIHCLRRFRDAPIAAFTGSAYPCQAI